MDLYSGKSAGALTQPESEVCGVAGVRFALNGAYAVTRNIRAIDEDEEADSYTAMFDTPRSTTSAGAKKKIRWCALNDDVIWSIATQKAVFKLANNRYVVSDRQETTLGFVNCTFHSVYDWPSNLYSFVAWRPANHHNNATATNTIIHQRSFINGRETEEENAGGEVRKVDFPELSEFLCPPVIYTDTSTGSGGSQSVIAVLQVCHKQLVGQSEGCRTYDNILYIASLDKKVGGNRTQTIHIADLLRFCDPSKDRFAHVYVTHSNMLLIYFVKGINHFTFDPNRGLVIPPGLEKGAVLYNFQKGMVVRHLPVVLDPKSDFQLCLWSRTSSIFVDNNLLVFNAASLKPQTRIKADLDPTKTVLALDGTYIVGLDTTGRCVHVYRTSDGHNMGSLFVHGKAGCINVGEDDRTIVVGCDDGRVLILSLVLGLSDPYKEFIAKLSYRTKDFQKQMLTEAGDYSHLLNEDFATADGKKPELFRLSQKIRTDVRMAVRKQASFKSLANAVLIANKQGTANSRMCSIQ